MLRSWCGDVYLDDQVPDNQTDHQRQLLQAQYMSILAEFYKRAALQVVTPWTSSLQNLRGVLQLGSSAGRTGTDAHFQDLAASFAASLRPLATFTSVNGSMLCVQESDTDSVSHAQEH